MACRLVAGLAFRGVSCPLPMMAFPLLVVNAGGGPGSYARPDGGGRAKAASG